MATYDVGELRLWLSHSPPSANANFQLRCWRRSSPQSLQDILPYTFVRVKKNLIWFSSDECLTSSQWEEVDYDLDDAMAGSSTSPTGTSADEVADPLGLGNQIK